MKTLRRKVKIGIKKYEMTLQPRSVEEEEQLEDFAREIENHKKRKGCPKSSIIELFTKSYWFPENYKSLYEPL